MAKPSRRGMATCLITVIAIAASAAWPIARPAVAADQPAARLLAPNGDLQLSVYTLGSPDPARPGTELGYSIILSHYGGYGGGSMSNVVLTETVPANTKFVAGLSTPGWSCADGSPAGTACVMRWPTLSFSQYVYFYVRINDVISDGALAITNTVTAGGEGDENASNNLASVVSPLELSNLAATKMAQLNDANGDGFADPGDSIDYRIVITNTGAGPATNVRFTDQVAQGPVVPGSFTSTLGTVIEPTPAYLGQFLEAQLGTISAGQVVTLSFRLPISTNVPARVNLIANQAHVSRAYGSLYTSTNVVSTSLRPRVDVSVTESITHLLGVGNQGPIQFLVDVSNHGSITATGVVVTKTLPPFTEFMAIYSAPGWACTGDTCTRPMGDLPPAQQEWGTTAHTVVTFALMAQSTLPTATVMATSTVVANDDGAHGPDADPASNTFQMPVVVGFRSPISFTKTALFAFDANGNGKVDAGDTIEYRLVLTNTGPRGNPDVHFIDDIPGACNFFYCSPWARVSAGTLSATRGYILESQHQASVYFGALAAGESVSATFRVFVSLEPPFSVPELTNQAALYDVFGPAGASNITSIPIARARDARISKTMTTALGRPYVVSGERITFTIVATNTGYDSLSGVVLRDSYSIDGANHTGYSFLTDTLQSSHGTPVVSGGSNEELDVNVGSLASGESVTLTFAAVAWEGPWDVRNIARIQWSFGYGGQSRDSNIVSTPIKRGTNLTVHTSGWSRPLTSTARSMMIFPSIDLINQPVPVFPTSAVITQQVPFAAAFDPAVSTPGWQCPDGGLPMTLCIFALGPPTTTPGVPYWSAITFAVTIDPLAVGASLRTTSTTQIAETAPAELPDPVPANNTTVTSMWFVDPVNIAQSGWVTDVNQNRVIDGSDIVKLQLQFTNMLTVALPPLYRFTSFVDYRLNYIYGTGFLVAPDGVFAPSNNPDVGCPNKYGSARGRIDPEIPPGFIVSLTFENYFSSYGGPPLTDPNRLMYSGVCDEYGTIVAETGTLALTYVDPPATATPTPSSTPTATSTSTATSMPTATSTPSPTPQPTETPVGTPIPNQVSPNASSVVTGPQGEVFAFDAGTFTDTVLIQIVSLVAQPPYSVPTGMRKTTYSYDIVAILASSGAQVQPTKPYTVTIRYIDQPGMQESSLALYYWTGSEWVREPTSVVDAGTNHITARPNHTSVWAILGSGERKTWLPMTVR